MTATLCERTISPQQAAMDFFQSLARTGPRDFFRMNLVHSYAEAITAHHPESEFLDPFAISYKVVGFVDALFSLLDRYSDLPDEHEDLLLELNKKRKAFCELSEAHRNYRAFCKQEKRFDYLSRYVKGTSLVDVGCGSGELLRFIATHAGKRFTKLTGIEIGDFRKNKDDFGLHVLDLRHQTSEEPIQAETGLILSALHHIDKDRETIIRFLRNVHSLGMQQLIVEEDILVAPQDHHLPITGISTIAGVRQKQFKLRKYLELAIEDQQAVTTMADYLSNMMFGAYPMPFPFAFQTVSDWQAIFNEAGWKVVEFEMLGFQQGNFNQVCHALFVLKPKL